MSHLSQDTPPAPQATRDATTGTPRTRKGRHTQRAIAHRRGHEHPHTACQSHRARLVSVLPTRTVGGPSPPTAHRNATDRTAPHRQAARQARRSGRDPADRPTRTCRQADTSTDQRPRSLAVWWVGYVADTVKYLRILGRGMKRHNATEAEPDCDCDLGRVSADGSTLADLVAREGGTDTVRLCLCDR